MYAFWSGGSSDGMSDLKTYLSLTRYPSPNQLCLLQTGVHGLAFKGEHAKDAFVNAAKRFLPNEAFQCFNAKSKFAKCQRALGRHRATTEAL
jgi:hypothetical protein